MAINDIDQYLGRLGQLDTAELFLLRDRELATYHRKCIACGAIGGAVGLGLHFIFGEPQRYDVPVAVAFALYAISATSNERRVARIEKVLDERAKQSSPPSLAHG